jgi:hypothetical protein
MSCVLALWYLSVQWTTLCFCSQHKILHDFKIVSCILQNNLRKVKFAYVNSCITEGESVLSQNKYEPELWQVVTEEKEEDREGKEEENYGKSVMSKSSNKYKSNKI